MDIIGSSDPISDAEVLAVAVDCLRSLGFNDFQIRLNDRRILEAFMEAIGIRGEKSLEVFRTLDKLDKIGKEEVMKLLGPLIDEEKSERLLELTSLKGSPETILNEVRRLLSSLETHQIVCESLRGITEYAELFGFSQYLTVDLSLARGLDYYTGPVFEVSLAGERVGSVAGGGRYDHLIELYGGRPTPATGISLGIERIMTLLEQRSFLDPISTVTQIFVASTPLLKKEAIGIARRLREAGLHVDTDLVGRNLANQLEYVDKKGITLVLIVGEKELREGCVALRDMKKKKQINVKLEELVNEVRAHIPTEQ